MNFEIKFKSIAFRWFINVFAATAAIVIAVCVAVSIGYSSLYIERIRTIASDYASQFESLSSSAAQQFEDSAIKLADVFEHKTKIEVLVIDADGRSIVSTTGFQLQADTAEDFERACNSTGHKYLYNGRNSGGEHILSETIVVTDKSGVILGGYSWITSLKQTDSKLTGFILVITLAGMAIIGFCALTGLFFVKSIIKPVRGVSNIARTIAMGDFDARIEYKKNDEIGELCDTINYMASELTQAEKLKNDFISSVSHELRTPLTAIRGWGETAKMSLGSDEELVRRGLDVVLSESDRLSGLVEELLDFSRMQSGRLSLNTRPVIVANLLEEAANMYTELAKRQGIELTLSIADEQVNVMGDPDRLKQVFINIIDNAVKYTENGGLVLIEQSVDDTCVQITVKDTGVGIPAQDIDRVKEKFFKSNKTVRGSGIGLAVADEIIKQHKGLLFLESTEGVGTTATIVLPFIEPEPEPEPVIEQLDEQEKPPEAPGTEE